MLKKTVSYVKRDEEQRGLYLKEKNWLKRLRNMVLRIFYSWMSQVWQNEILMSAVGVLKEAIFLEQEQD